MRHLSLFIWGLSFTFTGFSQSRQTVTLVFVPSGNDSHKNYEAVVDDVSYYSENNASDNNHHLPQNNRNTIWLNNFPPGEHSIKVYNIQDGSNNERAANSPVYSSTFTVKQGYDTKIAVKNNGHIQFSERLISNDNHSGNVFKKNVDVHSPGNNNYSTDNKISNSKSDSGENDDFDKDYKNKQFKTASIDENDSDISGNSNLDGHERHSRKRLDTAIIYNDANNDDAVTLKKNSKGGLNNGIHNRKSNYNLDDKNNDDSRKHSMSDDHFNELYQSVRNQWLPGQKMKTLSNEFLNAEDNFSTVQARQLIQLITEEGNRLKLAKSVYPCITDLENFNELDNLLRYKKSRDELNDFVSKGGKD